MRKRTLESTTEEEEYFTVPARVGFNEKEYVADLIVALLVD